MDTTVFLYKPWIVHFHVCWKDAMNQLPGLDLAMSALLPNAMRHGTPLPMHTAGWNHPSSSIPPALPREVHQPRRGRGLWRCSAGGHPYWRGLISGPGAVRRRPSASGPGLGTGRRPVPGGAVGKLVKLVGVRVGEAAEGTCCWGSTYRKG